MKLILTILLFASLNARAQVVPKTMACCRVGSTSTQDYALSLSYPVSVFSVNNANIGVAADSSQFKALWNIPTEDQAKGTLNALTSLLFRLTVNAGQSAPGALLFSVVQRPFIVTNSRQVIITNAQNVITLNQ
jgi:hypothetical protein